MRTAAKLAIASTGLLMLGFFIACGSSDEEATGGSGGGFVNKGGAAGTSSDAGGAAGVAGAAGNAGTIIVTDSSPNDVIVQQDACAANAVQATLKPANILFLIDRTGSMNCNAPPTQTTQECEVAPKKKDPAQPSKWETTRDAFLAALTELKATTPVPSIGMMLFNNNDGCGAPSTPDVDVAELTDPQLNTLSLKLNAVVPKGNTPIVGATMSGYQFMFTNTFVGNKFVVLLTDGNETCDIPNMDFLVGKAEEASTLVGIRTFVLGAPGSESGRAFLSRLAWAGGTASSDTCDHVNSDPTIGDCHIDMTQPGTVFKDELAAALQKVSGAALSCEIDVPANDGGKEDPNKVNVKYTSGGGTTSTIPKDEVHPCDQTNQGWQYTDASKTKIVVCGATCDTIKSDPKGALSVELGCETQIPK